VKYLSATKKAITSSNIRANHFHYKNSKSLLLAQIYERYLSLILHIYIHKCVRNEVLHQQLAITI